MQLVATQEKVDRQQVDALVVGVFQEELTAAADAVDAASGGVIRRLLDLQEFKPEIGQAVNLYCLPGVSAPVVTVVGCGDKSCWDRGAAFRATGPLALADG